MQHSEISEMLPFSVCGALDSMAAAREHLSVPSPGAKGGRLVVHRVFLACRHPEDGKTGS